MENPMDTKTESEMDTKFTQVLHVSERPDLESS